MTTGSRDSPGPSGGGVSDYVDFCVEHVTAIVREIGPRAPGSDEERRAQEYLAGLLRPYSDAVTTEEFSVAPKAFMGFIPVSGGLLLAGVIVYGWLPAATLVCTVLAILLAVGELALYREVIDGLFRRAVSRNLVATIRPRGEVRRILLLGGHCDSAYEWRWHYLGPIALRVIVGGTLLGALVSLGAATLGLLTHGLGPPAAGTASAILGWVLVAFAPCFLLVMGFSNFRRVSPGASDNLTGVMLTVALAKYIRDAGISLEHTELRLLNTGSEEAGLRGARAYAELHREELTRTPSLYVALDTFRDLEHMAIYDRDRNGTVRHDPGAARLLADVARRAGWELPFYTIQVGATDAAAFTQAGLRAIALIAMDPALPRWYHTRLDTPELLNPACIEAGLQIAIELVRSVDADGLPEMG
jgi:hypothetical protein